MHFNEENEDSRILQSFTIQSFVLFGERSTHTTILAAHTAASLYDTTIKVRLLQILQLLRYIKTEGEPDTCFPLLIAVPFHMSTGLISVYKTLGFVKRNAMTDEKEGWTQLQYTNLIALPRYTFRQAFIKYRTPICQGRFVSKNQNRENCQHYYSNRQGDVAEL